jgi:hypothetical protein
MKASITDKMVGWRASNELARIWKEAVMAYFEILSTHFSERAEKNHDDASNDMTSSGQNLSPWSTECDYWLDGPGF